MLQERSVRLLVSSEVTYRLPNSATSRIHSRKDTTPTAEMTLSITWSTQRLHSPVCPLVGCRYKVGSKAVPSSQTVTMRMRFRLRLVPTDLTGFSHIPEVTSKFCCIAATTLHPRDSFIRKTLEERQQQSSCQCHDLSFSTWMIAMSCNLGRGSAAMAWLIPGGSK